MLEIKNTFFSNTIDYFVDIAHRPHETSAEPTVTMRSVKIESVKTAYNSVTAASVVKSATGHSKLVHCQHDPGSQLTFITSSWVEDLRLELCDIASFIWILLLAIKILLLIWLSLMFSF